MYHRRVSHSYDPHSVDGETSSEETDKQFPWRGSQSAWVMESEALVQEADLKDIITQFLSLNSLKSLWPGGTAHPGEWREGRQWRQYKVKEDRNSCPPSWGQSTGSQFPMPAQESPVNSIKKIRFTGKREENVLLVLLKPQSYSLGNKWPHLIP